MKDRYINVMNQKDRLINEWLAYGSLIVAYDFDDTVFDYHKRGDTFETVINQLKVLGHMGCTMICFTSCDTHRYPEIREYLNENNIPCHGINIDSEKVPFRGRKIYYNVFYDDRAGLGEVCNIMLRVIENITQHVYKFSKNLDGTHCHYSGKKFQQGEWEFDNKYPAAFNEYRKKNDIIPSIEELYKLFPK